MVGCIPAIPWQCFGGFHVQAAWQTRYPQAMALEERVTSHFTNSSLLSLPTQLLICLLRALAIHPQTTRTFLVNPSKLWAKTLAHLVGR